MRTSFTSDNFRTSEGLVHVGYTTNAPVYAGHIRVGWRGNISPSNIMDIYGVYSHSPNHDDGSGEPRKARQLRAGN